MAGWLAGWLVGWLVGWLAGWRVVLTRVGALSVGRSVSCASALGRLCRSSNASTETMLVRFCLFFSQHHEVYVSVHTRVPSVSCALLRWYACLLLQFVGSLLQTVCCVVVWLCGCVAVWLCGCVAVWLCGCVAVSLCRCVVVSLCRCVVVSLCRCVVVVVRCKKRVQVSKKLFRTIQPSVIHPSVPSSIHSFIGPLIPSFLPSFCTQHSAPPTTHGRTDGRNTQHTTNKLQTAHSLTH